MKVAAALSTVVVVAAQTPTTFGGAGQFPTTFGGAGQFPTTFGGAVQPPFYQPPPTYYPPPPTYYPPPTGGGMYPPPAYYPPQGYNPYGGGGFGFGYYPPPPTQQLPYGPQGVPALGPFDPFVMGGYGMFGMGYPGGDPPYYPDYGQGTGLPYYSQWTQVPVAQYGFGQFGNTAPWGFAPAPGVYSQAPSYFQQPPYYYQPPQVPFSMYPPQPVVMG